MRDHINIDVVRRDVPPFRDCACTIEKRTIDYQLGGESQVVPLLQDVEGRGFHVRGGAAPKGTDFVVTRLAAGSAELRDMIIIAWRKPAPRRPSATARPRSHRPSRLGRTRSLARRCTAPMQPLGRYAGLPAPPGAGRRPSPNVSPSGGSTAGRPCGPSGAGSWRSAGRGPRNRLTRRRRWSAHEQHLHAHRRHARGVDVGGDDHGLGLGAWRAFEKPLQFGAAVLAPQVEQVVAAQVAAMQFSDEAADQAERIEPGPSRPRMKTCGGRSKNSPGLIDARAGLAPPALRALQ